MALATRLAPPIAFVVLLVTWGRHPGGAAEAVLVTTAAVALAAAVLAAVHHAEIVAHRVGEPFGSLVLAVAVTIIEVALIITLMVTSTTDTSTLARDTEFALQIAVLYGLFSGVFAARALRLWRLARRRGTQLPGTTAASA